MLSVCLLNLLVLSCLFAGHCWDLDTLLQDSELGVVKEYNDVSTLQAARYTAGYIRTDYTDVGPEGKFFVQADVVTIGVCYASTTLVTPGAPTLEPTAPPTAIPGTVNYGRLRSVNVKQELGQYQKLVAVRVDTAGTTFSLYYQDFNDPACTTSVNAFTIVQRFQGSALTSNNVLLKTDRRYIESEGLATAVPSFNNGFIVSFFGSLAVCTGQPFKYLVGTDKCENYLDFFGRVECTPSGLTYYEYPFSPAGACPGGGSQFREQPLSCSNEGTIGAPNYQSAECINVAA